MSQGPQPLQPIVLFDSAGRAMAVQNGVVIPANTSGLLATGSDGTTARTILTDASGRQIVNQGLANTLANAWPHEITDGTNGPVAVKPASTPAVVADPSLVVTQSPNSVPLAVYLANSSTTTFAGTAPGLAPTGTLNIAEQLHATTYTEQTTNFTGSVVSSSANDTGAGTGARTIKITYYDQTGAGPLTESATLNGVTPVNLVNANHCFIESIQVITVGSNGSNVGTITLFTGAGGAGTNVASIGVGNLNTGGDMRTLLGHHYVTTGKSTSISAFVAGTNGNQNGVFYMTQTSVLVANAAAIQFSGMPVAGLNAASVVRIYPRPLVVAGFSRVNMWVVPAGNNTKWFGSFDFSDQ
jgi:hypothetical protein